MVTNRASPKKKKGLVRGGLRWRKDFPGGMESLKWERVVLWGAKEIRTVNPPEMAILGKGAKKCTMSKQPGKGKCVEQKKRKNSWPKGGGYHVGGHWGRGSNKKLEKRTKKKGAETGKSHEILKWVPNKTRKNGLKGGGACGKKKIRRKMNISEGGIG